MRTGMKRLFAAFAAGMLLFSTAFAQEDQELTEEDLFAQWDLEADETENVVLDENGEEHQVLSDAELAELDTLEDMGEVVIDESQLEINENLPDHVVNILLLGIDNRQDVTEGGRSDAMLICSINTQDGSIKLTSIQRDLLVTIPTKKNPYKITNAYSWGGGQLSMATVNQNFELNIDKFVTINFYGLAAIIDYLGGVDIELTKTEASRINYELKKEPLPFDTNPDRDKVEAVAGGIAGAGDAGHVPGPHGGADFRGHALCAYQHERQRHGNPGHAGAVQRHCHPRPAGRGPDGANARAHG